MKLNTLLSEIYLFILMLAEIVLAQEKGYHSLVGIPVAKRIYLSETTAAPGAVFVEETAPVDHNYLVGVVVTVNDSYSVCGASLLSSSRALTAAHCWWDGWRRAQAFTLVFGSEYVFVGGTRVWTRDVIPHSQWDPFTMINNLAMVKFKPIEYSKYIRPIALPDNLQNLYFVGSLVQASGYGKAMPDGNGYAPNQRQTHVLVGVVPTHQCINTTQFFMARTLCTRSKQHICISHSGGPLVAEHNKKSFLIGVASFGDYNCNHNENSLTGYVRVTSYLGWIHMNMKS